MRRFRALLGVAALVLAGQSATGSAARRPAAASAGTYRVRRGDTLSVISLRVKVPMATLVQLNHMRNPHLIHEGDVLQLRPPPAAAVKAQRAAAVNPVPPLPTPIIVLQPAVHTHVVVKGETLAGIAAAWQTTPAALAKANHRSVNGVLRTGTVLTLTDPPYLCPVQGTHTFVDSWGAPRAGGARHVGTDVLAARGTPVVAPIAGTVEPRHGARGGNAFYLHGDDGNVYYGAHLDRLAPNLATAQSPQRVARGAVIGWVGDSGDARGGPTHVHFEVHPGGGGPVDPYFTLRAWC